MRRIDLFVLLLAWSLLACCTCAQAETKARLNNAATAQSALAAEAYKEGLASAVRASWSPDAADAQGRALDILSHSRRSGDDSKCRSNDGQGGNDCWAGCHGDPYACAGGYTAVVSAEAIEHEGQACFKYTCVPSSQCDDRKCTSPGNDCLAYWEQFGESGYKEDMTCAAGYEALGGSGEAWLHPDDTKCTSPDGKGGRDCWANGWEPYTCADGYTSALSGEESGGYWKYSCYPPGRCRQDKCTSPNGKGGYDCWANINPAIEPATCSLYVTHAGTPLAFFVSHTAPSTCIPRTIRTDNITLGYAEATLSQAGLELHLRDNIGSIGVAMVPSLSDTSAANRELSEINRDVTRSQGSPPLTCCAS